MKPFDPPARIALDPTAERASSTTRVLGRRAFSLGLGLVGAAHAIGCHASREAAAPRALPPPAPTPVPVASSSAPSDTAAPLVEEPAPDPGPPPRDTKLALPDRPKGALTGSQFLKVAKAKKLGREAFDAAVIEEISAGNVPDFLRTLQPVTTTDASGRTASFLVLADYLAIGVDDDFIRAPMTTAAAQTLADLTKTMLPTRLLVDAIYAQAVAKLPPSWIDGGPTDDEIQDFKEHHQKLEKARKKKGYALGVLTGGDMKDIVLSNRLVDHPGRVAIYGWHKSEGDVVQHLSTAHFCRYADYSHGVRLVDRRVLVDGVEHDLAELMKSDELSDLVSDEGPLEVVAYAKKLPEYVAGTGKSR